MAKISSIKSSGLKSSTSSILTNSTSGSVLSGILSLPNNNYTHGHLGTNNTLSSNNTILATGTSNIFSGHLGTNNTILATGTSNIFSGHLGTNNTILATGTSNIFSGYSYSSISSFVSLYDFDDKTIDLEKLLSFDEDKRKLVLDLFYKFIDCSDSNSKKLMYNTLETYNLFIDRKFLQRKIKIGGII